VNAVLELPRELNAAVEYIDGAIAAGYGSKPHTSSRARRSRLPICKRRVNQAGNALGALGVESAQGVAILLPTRSEFVTAFFGQIVS